MVYRPVVSRVAAVGYALFALWWAVDDVLTGDTRRMMLVGPILVAVGALLWGVFWRPAVVVDDDGVELRNVVRDVHVPWRVLESLDTRYALTLHVGRRRYRSWAAGAPGRPAPLSHSGAARDHAPTGGDGALRSSRSLRADSGAAAFMVEQRWEQRRTAPSTGEERVTTRWSWPWPALAAAAVLSSLLVTMTR
jgi:hypothetical protein